MDDISLRQRQQNAVELHNHIKNEYAQYTKRTAIFSSTCVEIHKSRISEQMNLLAQFKRDLESLGAFLQRVK